MPEVEEEVEVVELEEMLNRPVCQCIHKPPHWPADCTRTPVATLHMRCLDMTGYVCLNVVLHYEKIKRSKKPAWCTSCLEHPTLCWTVVPL